jgi:hypothetical protein
MEVKGANYNRCGEYSFKIKHKEIRPKYPKKL